MLGHDGTSDGVVFSRVIGVIFIRVCSHRCYVINDGIDGDDGILCSFSEGHRATLEGLAVFDHNTGFGQVGGKLVQYKCYLVGLASSKMSLQVEGEALFSCSLYAFPSRDLAVAYFVWRQQETLLETQNSYCAQALLSEDRTPEMVESLLEGMNLAEKAEILLQHGIDLGRLPKWHTYGAAWLTCRPC